MGYDISNHNAIKLTRGDSLIAHVEIVDHEGNEFIPPEGSSVRFALKEDYDDIKPALVVEIPIDTMILELQPGDTKKLPYGRYVYDIQLTTPEGYVDTFISKGRFSLQEEVC